jgi:D-beta-D-heptose 7-phosphate kinase/D-beta-D-heptose 1-phosphate adenosyltransferase
MEQPPITHLTPEYFARFLTRPPSTHILVLGDVMLDHYIFGDVERISPEAPVPIVNMEKERWTLGGAANVANNLRALQARVTLFGLVGQDEMAWRLRSMAQDLAIDVRLFADSKRPTTVKTRILARGQQMLRVDSEGHAPMSKEILSLVNEQLNAIDPPDVVVISDYAKGFVTHELVQACLHMAQGLNAPVLVDPKPANWACYKGAYLVTPNLKEAEAMAGMSIFDVSSAQKAGETLLKRLQVQAVLITMGPQGMVLYSQQLQGIHLPTRAKEVFDVTGAGDTVIAVLAWMLAQGAGIQEAAYLANTAASVVVSKVGTATVSIQELMQTL